MLERYLVYLIRMRRGLHDFSPLGFAIFQQGIFFTVGGWFLHYMPFYIMGRVMYLHHYFPALYFSIISLGFLLNHLTRHCSTPASLAIQLCILVPVLVSFWFFSPFAYGMSGPASNYKNRQWLQAWNIY